MTAEWHFFATSHGKGPCDGLGGTLKRIARRTSLQLLGPSAQQIDTPLRFYWWAKEKFKNSIHIEWVNTEDVAKVTEALPERFGFKAAPAADGIFSSHAILPLSGNVVVLKQYSGAPNGLYLYFGPDSTVSFEDLHGFVTVYHDQQWHVAFIEKQIPISKEVQVSFLIREGTARSPIYRLPGPENRVTITKPMNDIMRIVNLKSHDFGVTFSMSRADSSHAKTALKSR